MLLKLPVPHSLQRVDPVTGQRSTSSTLARRNIKKSSFGVFYSSVLKPGQ